MAVTDKLSRIVKHPEINSRQAYMLSFDLTNFWGPSSLASSILVSYMDLPFYCSFPPTVVFFFLIVPSVMYGRTCWCDILYLLQLSLL